MGVEFIGRYDGSNATAGAATVSTRGAVWFSHLGAGYDSYAGDYFSDGRARGEFFWQAPARFW